jgi:hypothetical protein
MHWEENKTVDEGRRNFGCISTEGKPERRRRLLRKWQVIGWLGHGPTGQPDGENDQGQHQDSKIPNHLPPGEMEHVGIESIRN